MYEIDNNKLWTAFEATYSTDFLTGYFGPILRYDFRHIIRLQLNKKENLDKEKEGL